MHFDFCSAIDNARFFAEREAALRRCAQPAVATSPKPGRWYALPAGGRSGTRSHAVAPTANLKPAGSGSPVHAH